MKWHGARCRACPEWWKPVSRRKTQRVPAWAAKCQTSQPQSFDVSGADAAGGCASWTGPAVVCFAAAGFLGAACVAAGRGDGKGAFAEEDGAGAAARAVPAAPPAAGSENMMLTAGVDAAEGNSALVGLPVGIDDESMATGAAVPESTGDVHNGAYREMSPS